MLLNRFQFCGQGRTKILGFISSFFVTGANYSSQRKGFAYFRPPFAFVFSSTSSIYGVQTNKIIETKTMMFNTTSVMCPCCSGEGLVMKKNGPRSTAISRPLEAQLSILSDRSRPHHVIRPCHVCQGAGVVSDQQPVPKRHEEATTGTSQDNSLFHVSIVGGGIGGCALALALCQRNIPCTLYERDKSSNVRPQGYGLTIQQGFKALQSLGLINLHDHQHRSSNFGIKGAAHVVYRSDGTLQSAWGAHRSRRINGNIISNEPTTSIKSSKRQKRYNVIIPRKDLRQLIMDQIPSKVIKWGYDLVDYREMDGCKKIELKFSFSNGNEDNSSTVETTTTNVLVGADGIWSSVRKCMYQKNDRIVDPSPLRYLNCMVILGIAPTPLSQPDHPLKLDDERCPIIFETMDGETRLYGMPHRPGETMWQLSFPVASEFVAKNISTSGAEAMKQEAIRRCDGWHQPIGSLLMSTPVECITGYPLYDRPVPEPINSAFRKHRPSSHVTLIGDAAHPMAAFKAQGANQALLDAVTLARVLYRTIFLMSAASISTYQCIDDTDANLPFSNEGSPNTPYLIPRALTWFEDEMMERVQPKVIASADASKYLHTKLAITQDNITRSDTFKRLSRDKH